MAMRQLSKDEVNRLLLTLTLAGYVPERDFKLDENGQILARKEILPIIRRIPALSDADDALLHSQQPPSASSLNTHCST
ncbi:MAG: hypothetical protein AAGI69_13895 [Cyanobacteria bacterium P01_H01_bin.21]